MGKTMLFRVAKIQAVFIGFAILLLSMDGNVPGQAPGVPEPQQKAQDDSPGVVELPSEDQPGTKIVVRLEYRLGFVGRVGTHAVGNGKTIVGLKVTSGIKAEGPATKLTMAKDPTTDGALEVGDIITHVDGRQIQTWADYHRAMLLAGANAGKVMIRVRDVNSGKLIDWIATAERTENNIPPPKPEGRTTAVKVILIGLTDDDKIGEGCQKNLDRLESYLVGLPNFNAKRDLVYIAGNYSAREVLSNIEKMEVKESEALFCYYAGHGAFDPSLGAGDPSKGHFLSIPSGDLARRTLLGAIQSKKARLTVLITDTCNVKGKFNPIGGRVAQPTGIRCLALESLMYNYVGIVDINGSSHGQFGWYVTAGPEAGGFFTTSLVKTLQDSGNKALTWREFFEQASNGTSSFFKLRQERNRNSGNPNKELLNQADQRPQAFTFEVSAVKAIAP
jgi:hypothetical protein